MPVFTQRQLRRDLARFYTRDLAVQAVSQASAAVLGTFSVMTNQLINSEASGQNLYQGAYLYIDSAGTAIGIDMALTGMVCLVATYNTQSGSFFAEKPALVPMAGTGHFELHTRVSPDWKNDAIVETIRRLRVRQEVGINTIDGALVYTIDNAASPNIIDRILDVHLAADPSNSQNIDLRHITDWQIVSTATGNQLRLRYAVQASQQLLLDCIIIPILDSSNPTQGDLATVTLPDERWVLSGAAVKCYDFMIQQAPGQQVAQLERRRAEAAMEFSRLSTRFQPQYDKPIRFNDVVRGGGNYPGGGDGYGWW